MLTPEAELASQRPPEYSPQQPPPSTWCSSYSASQSTRCPRAHLWCRKFASSVGHSRCRRQFSGREYHPLLLEASLQTLEGCYLGLEEMYEYLVVRRPSDFSNLELGSKTPSAIVEVFTQSYSIPPVVHFCFCHLRKSVTILPKSTQTKVTYYITSPSIVGGKLK